MTGEITSSPDFEDYKTHSHKKKRVGKACDSCRIKKTKCDGKKPCNKCIADNKICVFTEKRKSKDRHHPQGYVELLETRIDLLSKSLEKLVKVATPHLPFLQVLNSEYEDGIIPINDVVSYLITKEGLLKNLPVDWENGAMIAANLPSDEAGIKKASKEFAEHSKNLESFRTSLESCKDESILESSQKLNGTYTPPTSSSSSQSSTVPVSGTMSLKHKSSIPKEIKLEEQHQISIPKEVKLEDDSDSQPNYIPDSYYQNHTANLGEYTDKSLSQSKSNNHIEQKDYALKVKPTLSTLSGANDIFSFSELDSSNEQESLSPTRQMFDLFDDEHSIFSKNTSMTSLTNKFEDHAIKSPINTTPRNSISCGSGFTLRKSSSYSRTLSPQLKPAGVMKPLHSHSHSLSAQQNPKNEFRFSKIMSNSQMSTPTNDGYNNAESPNEFAAFELNDPTSIALPSSEFFSHPDYERLNIMDTDNNEALLINNPFLTKP